MGRNMIIVGGGPRTGRSTLARNIAENLHTEYDTRYISFGETVRAIGHHAIVRGSPENEFIDSFYSGIITRHLESQAATDPLDDETAYGVMHEALTRTDNADLVIVDGYPKNKVQAIDLIELAEGDERTLSGLIIATVHEEEALTRMLKRGRGNPNQPQDESAALERMRKHSQSFGEAVLYLASKGLPIESIDTSGPKEESANQGVRFAKAFLNPNG